MEFSTRAAELTTLLESRITNFYTNFQVDEIGRVVSVGDGIARVYGFFEIQAGEMVKFVSGVKGIALNLENENVGMVVFFFLILILVFVSLILIPQITYMIRETSTAASSSSSSSNSNKREKKRKDFFEKTRSMVLQKLLEYLERNGPRIKEEFPGATDEVEKSPFLGKLLREVLSDVGLQDSLLPDQDMDFLRKANRTLEKSLEDTDSNYKNFIYYSLAHILNGKRRP